MTPKNISHNDLIDHSMTLQSNSINLLSPALRSMLTANKTTFETLLVEVARNCSYQLSSAYRGGSTSGVVAPNDRYFFHTDLGKDQYIRIDLGQERCIRRIEITNRRDTCKERANLIFAELLNNHGKSLGIFPVYNTYTWNDCAIEVADIHARYLIINSPINTYLHFADVRVYALGDANLKDDRLFSERTAVRTDNSIKNNTGIDVIKLCSLHHIPIKGLIHVGANNGQEYQHYHKNLQGALLYVEAIPELAAIVQAKLDPRRPHYLCQAVASDTSGEIITFNIASNNGESSSMFDLGQHAKLYPGITYNATIELTTKRLDDIVQENPAEPDNFNVLVLDVQGAELKVLKGAPKLLSRVDAVVAEVSSEPLYVGGCAFHEVTNLLATAGLVFSYAAMGNKGWGNAFYTRSRS